MPIDWTTGDALAALNEVKMFSEWQLAPKLEEDDLKTIIANTQQYTVWAASTAVVEGNTYQPTSRNGHRYVPLVNGTTGTTQPTWPTYPGSTVGDGTVTWKEVGIDYTNLYDVDEAIRKCWEVKMNKATVLMSTQSPEQRNDAQQVYEHCKQQVTMRPCMKVF